MMTCLTYYQIHLHLCSFISVEEDTEKLLERYIAIISKCSFIVIQSGNECGTTDELISEFSDPEDGLNNILLFNPEHCQML